MLKDVFYFGSKPNAHPRERYAPDLETARKLSTTDHFWIINEKCDYRNFDWDWDFDFLPDEEVWASEHINIWPSQWQKDSGTWCVYKYNDTPYNVYRADVDPVRRKKEITSEWKILQEIEPSSFDFSWHPDPTDPPYIYVFGNQYYSAQKMPTIEYHTPGATDRKYVFDIVPTLASRPELFEILVDDYESFDFGWRPDPDDPPLTYVFGCKQHSPTVLPMIKFHTEEGAPNKFVDGIYVKLKQRPELFTNKENIEKFDYSWIPNPTEPPFIYQFGTQWQKTHGPVYTVPGATEVKFVEDYKAIIKPDMSNWEIPEGVDTSTFDFSWHPDATSPPYIYQFGTIVNENDGPRYITPGNSGEVVSLERPDKAVTVTEFPRYYIKTSLEDLIKEHPDEVFWALNPDIDYSEFNFDWRPNIQQINYVHAFGTEENINTQTYFVNAVVYNQGHTDINYIIDNTLQIKTRIDMFFIDRSNTDSEKHFNAIKARFPYVQKTRYLNSWVDTISRCLRKANSKLVWILNSELDYSTFEFDYYPNPWQMKMIHVFGTQYSHWGTTFMVNKESFDEDTKYVKIIEHLSMLNFVKNRKANAVNCLYDMYVIDHGNDDTNRIVDQLKDKVTGKNLTVVKYKNNYLETFKELLNMIPERKEHYIWVASSICDYSNFDFKYICDPFSKDQLHVFPSEKQKFGDTFLVDVNRLRMLIEDMDTLEDYKKVNFNQHMRVQRLPAPVIITEGDTHVSSINTDFNFPYAVFQTSDNKDLQVVDNEPMSLWDNEHKNIIVTSTGGTRIVVPKEAKQQIKKELYDYPYIVKNFKQIQSKPLDIVFLSNGETGADENYEHLLNVTNGLPNRVVRVDGVNGRVQAYHAAAEASETPWMFTVFAKLRVNKNFDWSWQPDRLQVPKHYIFHATNPVNKLVYGHQAMIAYNKKITLANVGRGLDFTLDDEHEVVELNSGVAMYNTDAWSTWRTSFREVLKLRADTSEESKQRLNIWLTVAEGNFAEYSIRGAKDAIEYYEEVNGDLDKLRLSYEWSWLKEKFNKIK